MSDSVTWARQRKHVWPDSCKQSGGLHFKNDEICTLILISVSPLINKIPDLITTVLIGGL